MRVYQQETSKWKLKIFKLCIVKLEVTLTFLPTENFLINNI